MKNLFNLLERFSKSLNNDAYIKDAISKTIKEKCRVNLDLEKISLKDGVLEIETTQAAKNEINLKESNIKGELASQKIFVSRILYK